MGLNIGLNVMETEGRAGPALSGAPTSVAGLVLRSRRGPIDAAVRVSSPQQFVTRFGGYDPRFAGAYCVDGFFRNGGQQAYVARVVGIGSATASVTLKDRAGADTLTVSAGYRGSADPGIWGNDLYVGIADNPEFTTRLAAPLAGNQPARLQGQALAGGKVNLSPSGTAARRLAIKVDGAATATVVTLTAASLPVPAQATAADVAAAINAQAGDKVVAKVVSDALLIISRSKGATAKVDLALGADGDDATRKLLGFADGATTAAGADAGAAAYTEAQLESTAGLQVGSWIRFGDGISENWVRITRIEDRGDGSGGKQHFVVWDQPAASARNEYRVSDAATVSTLEFDLTVSRRGATSLTAELLETWEKLTLDATRPNYAPLKVNDAYTGSTVVVVQDSNATAFSGQDVPKASPGIRLGLSTPDTATLTRVAGSDGAEPTAGAYQGAMNRFDTVDIQLLSVPENVPDAVLRPVTRAGLDYCAGRGDCMFVGHTPVGQDADGARAFGQDFRAAKVYGALYWPWITVTDPAGNGPTPTKVVPPTGHVLGVYARIDQTRNVWKAPAGDEAVIRGALAVERDLTDVDNTELVKNGSVNSIRAIRGAGIVIDTSRTLSTDSRWLYVNVRLLFNYIKASLRDGLRWVKQEPNRDTLWNKIKYNSVNPFLLRLHQAQAFGTGAPADVFTVVCGPENNPPSEVALGNLKVEVYFYPSRPAETILISVGQQDSGATAREA